MDRITVSVDEETEEALDRLNEESTESQSEIVRNAIAFYESNYAAAGGYATHHLQDFYEMVASGEHVLLDVDFLYLFLENLYHNEGYDSEFIEEADRVSDYHAHEYAERFDSVGELLNWLSFCGFISLRKEVNGVYHIVFPSDAVRWFMVRFIERSCAKMDTQVRVESSVSKALIIEGSPDKKQRIG